MPTLSCKLFCAYVGLCVLINAVSWFAAVPYVDAQYASVEGVLHYTNGLTAPPSHVSEPAGTAESHNDGLIPLLFRRCWNPQTIMPNRVLVACDNRRTSIQDRVVTEAGDNHVCATACMATACILLVCCINARFQSGGVALGMLVCVVVACAHTPTSSDGDAVIVPPVFVALKRAHPHLPLFYLPNGKDVVACEVPWVPTWAHSTDTFQCVVMAHRVAGLRLSYSADRVLGAPGAGKHGISTVPSFVEWVSHTPGAWFGAVQPMVVFVAQWILCLLYAVMVVEWERAQATDAGRHRSFLGFHLFPEPLSS